MVQNVNPRLVRRLRAWLAAAGLLLCVGCGSGKGDITGEVTYNDEPLSLGRITFVSEVGRRESFSAFIIRGKYTIKGFPSGPVKVSIESVEPPSKEKLKAAKEESSSSEKRPSPGAGMAAHMKVPDELKEMADGPPLKYMKIPLFYANPETSKLTYTVERGEQTQNFALKAK